MSFKIPTSSVAIVVSLASACIASAAPDRITHGQGEIGNSAIVVRANNGDVTLTDRVSGRVFASSLRLDGAGSLVREEAANDPTFGAGRRMVFARKAADGTGGEIALEVYPDLPFVLIREAVKNTTNQPVDLQKVVPASFVLDLGKAPAELTTMGTGGLAAVDKNPGSYLFLTCADPATREGVVAGWVTQRKGSGTVFSSVNQGKVEFKAQLEHGHLILQPSQSGLLDTFAVGRFADARIGEEALASAIAKAHAIKLRPKKAVYMTWYAEGPSHGGAGTQENTVELAKFCTKERLQDYGMGYIQVDDQWQDGPQIGGPARHFDRVRPNGPYKSGIGPVAKAVEAEGLGFGLWWMPFSRNHMEGDFKDKQHWFWKRPDGTPLRQNAFGGTCLDATVPEVEKDLVSLGRLLRSWNVTYYKMDGFSTGAGVDQVYINDGYKDDGFGKCQPAHDATKTNIEVMRKGISDIRKGAGNDVFFSACAATQNMRMYAGTIGLVDAMRVGPDFNHDGQGIRSGPLRGSRMYFLNGKVWWNDPDPTKVRTSNEGCDADPSINGAVTLVQARLTSSWVALTDQFYLISDWLPNLPQERLDILRRTMASHGATTRPVDYFDNALPNTWLVSSDKSGVKRDVVGVFNFYGQPLQAQYTFAKVGLDPEKTYHAFDFWANHPVADLKDEIKQEVAPMSCRVLALRAKEGHPVLVSTSRHVSQGILEVKGESWKDGALTGISQVIGGDAYELRIDGLREGGKQWTPASVIVSEEDKKTGVTISSVVEAGLLRVKVASPTNRDVRWKVTFDAKAPTPETVSNLSAVTPEVYKPVSLSWKSSARFHTITRDGKVIAEKHYGESFSDPSAEPGTHHYTVAAEGSATSANVSVTVPPLPPIPPAPEVKLGSLKPLSTQNGWGSVQTDKSVDGGPLTVGGEKQDSGLGLHAPARLVYTRSPEWKRFVAHVGLNENQRKDPRTSIVCKVVSIDGAGKESILVSSPVMRFGGMERFPVDVVLPTDCTKVAIIAEEGEDGMACDHANWGNAGFLK